MGIYHQCCKCKQQNATKVYNLKGDWICELCAAMELEAAHEKIRDTWDKIEQKKSVTLSSTK